MTATFYTKQEKQIKSTFKIELMKNPNKKKQCRKPFLVHVIKFKS